MKREAPKPDDSSAAYDIAELLLEKFPGRDDRVCRLFGDQIESIELDAPLRSDELAENHLSQDVCLAVYPLQDDGTVRFACIDIDDKDERPDKAVGEKVTKIAIELRRLGIVTVVERSQGGKGFHIWLSFNEPVPAWMIRSLLKQVIGNLGIREPEIFPKQARLKRGRVGNCVRYPLFNKSRFLDVDDGLKELDALAVLTSLPQYSVNDIRAAAAKAGITLSEEESGLLKPVVVGATKAVVPHQVAELLADEKSAFSKRWQGSTEGLKDTSRSSVVFSMIIILVKNFVPKEQIKEAIRVWCEARSYEKGLSHDWVEHQIEKAYEFVARRFRAVPK